MKHPRGRNRPPARLEALQRTFAGHIRDPEHATAPSGIEPRRMAVYRRLFFNNLNNLCASRFPRLRQVLETDRWERLIRDFMRNHRCRTPLFPELAGEFLLYLQQAENCHGDPPYIRELAHFEWLERDLRFAECEISDVACDPDGDPIDGIPVVSPLAHLASYRFAVHRIQADTAPPEVLREDTLLLVYRNRRDQTGFLKLSPATAKLFQLLSDNHTQSGLELLGRIAREMGQADPEPLATHGRAVLHDFRRRDILLGTRHIT